MSSLPQTATSPAPSGSLEPATGPGSSGPGRAQLWARAHARHIGFVLVVGGSAVLNTNRLSQNGWANVFYAAGDQSMLRSLHNFLYVSFDPGGLVSVDKPPLAMWLQVASAKIFGFTPLSLLLPEAIAGVLAVAALYLIIARRLGALAAFAGALAMAVFPSFVAVSRENGVDALLILLLVLACGAALRASETGRWRSLVLSGVLVGLAFNTKTLAAYLVIPGIALAYVLCAPGTLPRRGLQLLVAGLVTIAVSCAWLAFVDLTPASKRPYVGSSTNNSEFGLAFEYNGFGRVEGQAGGPHSVVVRPGARVPLHHHTLDKEPKPPASGSAKGASTLSATTGPAAASGSSSHREKYPVPFGGPPGALRLFGIGLGDQGAWMVPFAFFGLIAVAALGLLERRRGRGGPDSAPRAEIEGEAAREELPAGRRDPRLAAALVLGGWFLVEAVVLSTSKGIVHPYYISALAPATGAMAGAGAVALLRLARGTYRLWALALASCAVASTVAAQLVLMHREHYLLWFAPLLIAGAAIGLGALVALRALALPALALLFVVLLIAPTGYAASTWLAPVEGTFPAAGPTQAAGAPGGFSVNQRDLSIYRALSRYVIAHRPGTRWAMLTVASNTAAPMMLMGLKAGALGGYSGTDPTLDGPGLARLVARGEARWILLGGEYSTRGGNLATKAVLKACAQLKPSVWHSPISYPYGLTLFDCAGHEGALAAS